MAILPVNQWMPHMYPFSPPAVLFFRINEDDSISFQMRMLEMDNTYLVLEEIYQPDPTIIQDIYSMNVVSIQAYMVNVVSIQAYMDGTAEG